MYVIDKSGSGNEKSIFADFEYYGRIEDASDENKKSLLLHAKAHEGLEDMLSRTTMKETAEKVRMNFNGNLIEEANIDLTSTVYKTDKKSKNFEIELEITATFIEPYGTSYISEKVELTNSEKAELLGLMEAYMQKTVGLSLENVYYSDERGLYPHVDFHDFKYDGKPAVLSTIKLNDNKYETIAFISKTGEELIPASRTSTYIEALALHTALKKRFDIELEYKETGKVTGTKSYLVPNNNEIADFSVSKLDALREYCEMYNLTFESGTTSEIEAKYNKYFDECEKEAEIRYIIEGKIILKNPEKQKNKCKTEREYD